ncbi:hypothetical protein PAMP_024119 [Pampus punctatissimus]
MQRNLVMLILAKWSHRVPGTGPRRGRKKMLFSLNSTLVHLVDSGRGPLGSGQLTGVPTVATA